MRRHDQLTCVTNSPAKVAKTKHGDNIQCLQWIVEHQKGNCTILRVERHAEEIRERNYVELPFAEDQEWVSVDVPLDVPNDRNDLVTVAEYILTSEKLCERRIRIDAIKHLGKTRLQSIES